MMTTKKTSAYAEGADLSVERRLFGQGHLGVIGMDEVGRGSLAGPVTVGASWVPADAVLEVPGLTDSKVLSAPRREAMVPAIRSWIHVETGSSSPEEIDALGMTQALRLAGLRAMNKVALAVGEDRMNSSAVLLDGKHDWLTRVADLLSLTEPDPVTERMDGAVGWELPVTMQVKGDYRCASIAAASVVAKVERDSVMQSLALKYPAYGWEGNKGYGSSSHRAALDADGPCALHRLSWSLGVSSEQLRAAWGSRG
ncbi:ribonuclease HII [Kocuria sp. TGY1127_2]|uniref:ribonuclease HII n=1 Tax=Kocuria sp. TGY1127_2 TaxID=2711328 RepID=UPI001FAC179D|nr:ribonuclease HII [Kocuria sp. TGY1127_2]